MNRRILLLVIFAAMTGAAHAERADRDKPLQLEANTLSIDDANKIQILEGDVVVIKGTMVLRADKVVVTEDQYGFQKGVATGGKDGLARIRQKREGREDYVDGEAERIEYNTGSEIAEFFRRAWVKSGEDQVRGDYIWHDGVSEKYLVTSGKGKGDAKGTVSRVRAIIQSKSKPQEGASATGLELKPVPAPATSAARK